jgi:hypothetical protein
MTLQTSGSMTLEQIQTEFGGPSPVVLENYYRGGSYVPNTTTNASVPTSGAITFPTNFYGASVSVTGSISGGGSHSSSSSTGFTASFSLTASTNISSASYSWSVDANGTLVSSSGASATVDVTTGPGTSTSAVVTCTITGGGFSTAPTTTCTALDTYCFSGNVRILTNRGYKRFDELPAEFIVVNHTGEHRAQLLVHENCTEPLRRMGDGFVTERHLIKVGDLWLPARDLFREVVTHEPVTVYNAHVLTDSEDDHHYILENGLTAHNTKG